MSDTQFTDLVIAFMAIVTLIVTGAIIITAMVIDFMSRMKPMTHTQGEIPTWAERRLKAMFGSDMRRVLSHPAPSRGGVDAWTWVENGHSWNEIIERYERVLDSDVTQ